MIVRGAVDDDIRHICRNLRPEDRHEQLATRWSDDVDELAAEIIEWRRLAIREVALCCDDGEATILLGIYLIAPEVARFNMCATTRLPEIARAAHRWARRFIPAVLGPTVSVAETRLLAEHTYARRWVATFGFVEEGIHRRRGNRGEDLVTIAWINPERQNVLPA
jgi:hypothetical protein